MKKVLKTTGKVLTGTAVLAGVGTSFASANDIDYNIKNQTIETTQEQSVEQGLKVAAYEQNGHYYVKLSALKDTQNIRTHVTVDGKKVDFKKKALAAGQAEVYEITLDGMKVTQVGKKLPKTSVVAQRTATKATLKGHVFDVVVEYDVVVADKAQKTTDAEKKAQDKNPGVKVEDGSKDKTQSLDEVIKGAQQADSTEAAKPEAETKPTAEVKPAEKPATETPKADEVKPAEPAAPVEPKVESKPTTDNVAPTDTPSTVAPATAPVSGTSSLRSAPAVQPRAVKTLPKQETTTPVSAPAVTPVVATSGSLEQQVQAAFLRKVNELRAKNGLSQLANNALLNTSSLARAGVVSANGNIDANVHGAKGSHELNAAKAAGYNGKILYNVAQVVAGNKNAEQIADSLIYMLYHEVNNVTGATQPYGHRNTLLNATATHQGAGVTIKNGMVSLVHHLNYTGAFNGQNPGTSTYLDGKVYTK